MANATKFYNILLVPQRDNGIVDRMNFNDRHLYRTRYILDVVHNHAFLSEALEARLDDATLNELSEQGQSTPYEVRRVRVEPITVADLMKLE